MSRKEGFLVSVCLRGDGVGEKEVWDFGVGRLHDRVGEILGNAGEMGIGKYMILEDIF